MAQVTVIIPCYNEANRLPVQEYRKFLFNNTENNIVFVNDGSTDDTLGVLEQLRCEFSAQIHILHLPTNVGKAEAVRKGILSQTNSKNRDIIGFMDADLATPFDELRHFLFEFSNPRIRFVFGSRFSRIGARIIRLHHRHYFGRIVATLVSIYLNIPIYDSQCGAKFFHGNFARRLFMEPFISRWLFDIELFKRISLLGLNVEDCSLELPLHSWTEKGGSKIGIKDYLRLPLEFGKVIKHYAHNKGHLNNIHSVPNSIALNPTVRTIVF